MEDKIALFLSRFFAVKKAVNNTPKTLQWLAPQKPELQDLCHDLTSTYTAIKQLLATKSSKHTFVKAEFEEHLLEYERNYADFIYSAGELAAKRRQNQFEDEIRIDEQKWISEGKTIEEYYDRQTDLVQQLLKLIPLGSSFDPVKDNPAELVKDAKDLVVDILKDEFLKGTVLPEDIYGDHYDKVVGAWNFFEKTIGLDLLAIHTRWINAPDLFIKPHVAQTDTSPLVELYNEAVRAFVFGAKASAVTMCRAMMEHILKNHYGITEDELSKMIAMAELRYPQLKKERLNIKKRLADDVLHNFEANITVEDKAVVDFLKTIKRLVRDIPPRKK